jgi:hypothetical protein
MWWPYLYTSYLITSGGGLYYGYNYGLGGYGLGAFSCWTCFYDKGGSAHLVDLTIAGLLILVGLVGLVLTFRAQRRQRAKLASS